MEGQEEAQKQLMAVSLISHQEKELQAVDDRGDAENRLPVLSQDIQAYFTI